MRNPFRKQTEVRVQGSVIPMGEDTSRRGAYISNVIKKKYYNYYNIDHRVAVCKMDGIAAKLTYKWAERVVAKTFKFYTSHEVDGVEIMQEQRARWVELNCNEILKKSITPMIRDGFVLIEPTKKEDSLDYNVFGEYESSPALWLRDEKGKILAYGIQFTPRPRAMGSSALMLGYATNDSNFKAIKRTIKPKALIHVEYGEPNYGLGSPLLEKGWDSVIKLAGESHQDMLDRRSVPTLHLTEDDYDPTEAKAKGMLKMVANSDADIARVWYHKKLADQSYSEYPKFAQESPTSNPQYNTRNQSPGISTGDFGNVSKEWTRLTTVTGHSINWFMGNRAGATVGSETDKLSDDDQEIIDFGQLEGIIRKLLDWLDAQGLITIPEEPFVIKYWKDWERIELKEKIKEEMALTQDQEEEDPNKPTLPGKSDKDMEIDSQDNEPKKNHPIIKAILNSMKTNMSYVMTDVSSSWIDMIGYDDRTDKVFMLLLDGKVYSKPAPMGEWTYIDWEETGSKGRYFWDYLSQRDPPWQRDSIPAHLLSHFIAEEKQNIGAIKVPILDYQLIDKLDTETKIKHLGQDSDWSMGTSTATRIKNMLGTLKENANKHQLRINTMTAEAFGNSIKENHPLLYDIGNGIIVEEYICPDSWKKNVGTKVQLGVYHNLEQDIPELPDWQIIGDAEIFGWDNESGEDYVKYNYDYDKITEVFMKLGEYNWLTPALRDNGTNDISTAYYCDIEIKWNETLQKTVRVQTNIELKSISFVPRGNCPGEVCSLTVIKRNASEMQAYIKNCIAEGIEKDQCLAKAYAKFKE